ncbi:hypothetical protein EVG20_g1543 [Dentipellis fragilis]|uniref:Uncharacterized protein n=1 Tax=Dentipellis fragilis TaxID=205917 RepID=A0A4Y9Z9E5_9AGAM|nr:hypothetical protein EVG20_g1543 [Dentipellis fragilis]
MVDEYHDSYAQESLEDIKSQLPTVQAAMDKCAHATNFIQAYRASREYNAEAKQFLQVVEGEPTKKRLYFATQVENHFVKLTERRGMETLTSDEIDDMRSRVILTALNVAPSRSESKCNLQDGESQRDSESDTTHQVASGEGNMDGMPASVVSNAEAPDADVYP